VIDKGGYDRCHAEWVEDNAKRDKESETLKQKTIQDNLEIAEQQRKSTREAVESYAKHYQETIDTLNADAGRRMYVATKQARCDPGSASAKGTNPARTGDGNQETQRSELSAGMAELIQRKAAETQQLNVACQAVMSWAEQRGLTR